MTEQPSQAADSAAAVHTAHEDPLTTPAVPAEQNAAGSPAQFSDAVPAPLLPLAAKALPGADGAWEWQDYPQVRARIAQAKAEHRAANPVALIPVLDFDPAELADHAAQLQFQPPGALPLVSILIPVFNNAKLTLECLASIQQHLPAGLDVEIIVADDASTDQTQALLGQVANIRYLRNSHNLGFYATATRP